VGADKTINVGRKRCWKSLHREQFFHANGDSVGFVCFLFLLCLSVGVLEYKGTGCYGVIFRRVCKWRGWCEMLEGLVASRDVRLAWVES